MSGHVLPAPGFDRREPALAGKPVRLVATLTVRGLLEDNSRNRLGRPSGLSIKNGTAIVEGGVARDPVRRRRLD